MYKLRSHVENDSEFNFWLYDLCFLSLAHDSELGTLKDERGKLFKQQCPTGGRNVKFCTCFVSFISNSDTIF